MSVSLVVRIRFIGWNNWTYVRDMKLFYNTGIFVENRISRMMYLGNDVRFRRIARI
jgi:hypothetical protein